MKQALLLAKQAYDEGEIPIGALVVYKNQIIAKGYNQTECLKDATAHAEMIAITAASEYLNSKYLKDCTLYVTLEPCLMCGGALFWSQVPHIVYGAKDEQKGCISLHKNTFIKKTHIIGGVLEQECKELVLQFFKEKRENE
ncbi:MAG: nucleoside deaminase [Chitinophagales bacterium]|nr:nucleoside deaminase [Chitinophagales bacterium]